MEFENRKCDIATVLRNIFILIDTDGDECVTIEDLVIFIRQYNDKTSTTINMDKWYQQIKFFLDNVYGHMCDFSVNNSVSSINELSEMERSNYCSVNINFETFLLSYTSNQSDIHPLLPDEIVQFYTNNINYLSYEEIYVLQYKFSLYDINNDLLLTSDEIKTLITDTIPFKLSKEEMSTLVTSIVEQIDTNNDKGVNITEIYRAFQVEKSLLPQLLLLPDILRFFIHYLSDDLISILIDAILSIDIDFTSFTELKRYIIKFIYPILMGQGIFMYHKELSDILISDIRMNMELSHLSPKDILLGKNNVMYIIKESFKKLSYFQYNEMLSSDTLVDIVSQLPNISSCSYGESFNNSAFSLNSLIESKDALDGPCNSTLVLDQIRETILKVSLNMSDNTMLECNINPTLSDYASLNSSLYECKHSPAGSIVGNSKLDIYELIEGIDCDCILNLSVYQRSVNDALEYEDRLIKLFNYLDFEKEGYITIYHPRVHHILSTITKKIHPTLNLHEILELLDMLFSIADTNQDNKLSYLEFKENLVSQSSIIPLQIALYIGDFITKPLTSTDRSYIIELITDVCNKLPLNNESVDADTLDLYGWIKIKECLNLLLSSIYEKFGSDRATYLAIVDMLIKVFSTISTYAKLESHDVMFSSLKVSRLDFNSYIPLKLLKGVIEEHPSLLTIPELPISSLSNYMYSPKLELADGDISQISKLMQQCCNYTLLEEITCNSTEQTMVDIVEADVNTQLSLCIEKETKMDFPANLLEMDYVNPLWCSHYGKLTTGAISTEDLMALQGSVKQILQQLPSNVTLHQLSKMCELLIKPLDLFKLKSDLYLPFCRALILQSNTVCIDGVTNFNLQGILNLFTKFPHCLIASKESSNNIVQEWIIEERCIMKKVEYYSGTSENEIKEHLQFNYHLDIIGMFQLLFENFNTKMNILVKLLICSDLNRNCTYLFHQLKSYLLQLFSDDDYDGISHLLITASNNYDGEYINLKTFLTQLVPHFYLFSASIFNNKSTLAVRNLTEYERQLWYACLYQFSLLHDADSTEYDVNHGLTQNLLNIYYSVIENDPITGNATVRVLINYLKSSEQTFSSLMNMFSQAAYLYWKSKENIQSNMNKIVSVKKSEVVVPTIETHVPTESPVKLKSHSLKSLGILESQVLNSHILPLKYLNLIVPQLNLYPMQNRMEILYRKLTLSYTNTHLKFILMGLMRVHSTGAGKVTLELLSTEIQLIYSHFSTLSFPGLECDKLVLLISLTCGESYDINNHVLTVKIHPLIEVLLKYVSPLMGSYLKDPVIYIWPVPLTDTLVGKIRAKLSNLDLVGECHISRKGLVTKIAAQLHSLTAYDRNNEISDGGLSDILTDTTIDEASNFISHYCVSAHGSLLYSMQCVTRAIQITTNYIKVDTLLLPDINQAYWSQSLIGTDTLRNIISLFIKLDVDKKWSH